MEKIKLTIHNGHRNAPNGQTGTSGVTSSGQRINEVDFIDQVYYAIKKKIDSDLTLSSKIELSYDDANIVNGKTADYFIAIHADGSSDPNHRGGFVDDNPNDLVYKQSMSFAKSVSDNFFPKIGIPYVNGQTANSTYYYAFNVTGENTKQFIIECGTMTNKADMDKLADFQYAGSLILDGILNYFKANEPIFKQSEPTPQPPIVTEDKDKLIGELKQQLSDSQQAYKTLQNETAQEIAQIKSDCQQKLLNIKKKLSDILNSIAI